MTSDVRFMTSFHLNGINNCNNVFVLIRTPLVLCGLYVWFKGELCNLLQGVAWYCYHEAAGILLFDMYLSNNVVDLN